MYSLYVKAATNIVPPGLHFPTICDHYKERDVTSEVSYVVTWKGERAPSATCRLGFTGPVADSIYTRSVCFDTIYFNVKDCAVRLEFSEESGTKATVCIPCYNGNQVIDLYTKIVRHTPYFINFIFILKYFRLIIINRNTILYTKIVNFYLNSLYLKMNF